MKPLWNRLLKMAFALSAICSTTSIHADEGMWMLGNLHKVIVKEMKAEGLQLSTRQLYNPKGKSLKDAVVSFGGFCSGVVVSHEGLVLTNHHCGFESIQFHANEEHDYLTDGFVARRQEEELPCPDLYVRFLLRQENVTRRVKRALNTSMSEEERTQAIDSIALMIGDEVNRKDSTLTGVVDAYYGGEEYWLSVYRDYNDVRLVFAPPSSVGKFGWDHDNWEWPRHTGDFCLFRIYADALNRPANYDPDNQPYRPTTVAPISLQGYQPGTFCMTLGYPGTTTRYLSSFGIENSLQGEHTAQAEVRGIKQTIWQRHMAMNSKIRLMYASKYDQSSNYWKNSIGTLRSVRKLHLLERRREREAKLRQWIRQTPAEREKHLQLLTNLEQAYSQMNQSDRTFSYLLECFFNGPDLIQLAYMLLNFDSEGDEESIIRYLRRLGQQARNSDSIVDCEVFKAMLKIYRERVEPIYLPDFYQTIDTLYNGSIEAYADTLYSRSRLTSLDKLRELLLSKDDSLIFQDPAVGLCIDLLGVIWQLKGESGDPMTKVERGERELGAALRRMENQQMHYPDANSTLRLSYGIVADYNPADGIRYNYYTTPLGVFEKHFGHPDDPNYAVQPSLLKLFEAGDFGRYADKKDGQLHLCFITNNDITGGNSGSGIFNGKGELIGLAFDGNWEAMSSDLNYEPHLQRTIGVDIRYLLFIVEKQGQAIHLINEMTIID